MLRERVRSSESSPLTSPAVVTSGALAAFVDSRSTLTGGICFASISHPQIPGYGAQATNFGDMDNNVIHKVVIVGAARAGATLLMQLLTRLGLDTGYNENADAREELGDGDDAGVQRLLDDPQAAYIVKSTHILLELDSVLKSGRYKIDHAIIPIRRLDDAAASRMAVSAPTPQEFADSYQHAPADKFACYYAHGQKNALGRSLYNLIHAVAAHDIPHTLIDFPRFAHDPQYLFDKLVPILGAIDYAGFRAAFDDVVDLSLIHPFGTGVKDVA